MTKNILLVATALIALGAAPAFAQTTKVIPNSMSTSSSVKKVESKKIHHVKAVRHARMDMHKSMTGPRSQNAQERAITRELNLHGIQGV